MAWTPQPTATVAQNEKIHSSGRWEASMPRTAIAATMIRVMGSTAMAAVMARLSRRVWVRLICTVGRRVCQGPISVSAYPRAESTPLLMMLAPMNPARTSSRVY
ncbi:hypothetical protein [Streptacidiphilus sp. PAMC 29251]